MSAGKVAAGCAGFFLLFPGLCFFGAGLIGVTSPGGGLPTIQFIIIGIVILGGAGFLIRVAFRPPELLKIKPPTEQEPPKTE